MARRMRTKMMSQSDVDVTILQYSCLDNGALPSLGKSCYVSTWLLNVAGTSTMKLELTVDMHMLGKPQVSFLLGDTSIFPPGVKEKAKLKQDLVWQCPFRATIKGIGESGKFEMKPEHGISDDWYPATIKKQRADGLYEVTAFMPNGNELPKEVHFPAVRPEHLRELEGRKASVKPEMRTLVLNVPVSDPRKSTLCMDSASGSDLITHYFARRTPPPLKDGAGSLETARYEPPRVYFAVSQNRSKVTCKVGHAVLDHFLSGEVRRSYTPEISNGRAVWTVQIGPFAKHTIQLEKRYKSHVISLIVDGDLLAESTSEDLECPEDKWECTFRFSGERFLEWEVFEQTAAGLPLGTKGMVSQKTAYSHECTVSLPVHGGSALLSSARLTIDEKAFQDLPLIKDMLCEDELVLAPEALTASYNLHVPTKVCTTPPSYLTVLMATLGINCGQNQGLMCCGNGAAPQMQNDTVVMPGSRKEDLSFEFLDSRLLYPQADHLDTISEDGEQSPASPDNGKPDNGKLDLQAAVVPKPAPPQESKPTDGAMLTLVPPNSPSVSPVAKPGARHGPQQRCCAVQ